MKIENIPADIKSKSLKQARDEINDIISKLETKTLNKFSPSCFDYLSKKLT